jgi:hypothetical protein
MMIVKDFSYWPEKAAAKMAAVPVRGAVFQLAEHGNNNGNNS